MKIPVLLSLATLALGLCAPSASAHECTVVCEGAHSSPVCGNNGKTYASECFLEFAKCQSPKLKLAHPGACPTTKSKAKSIHISITKTHAKQETKNAEAHEDGDEDEDDEADEDDDEDDNTKTKKKATALSKESKDEKCEKACSRELEQVCASDGKTYNNHCLFEIAQCYNSSLTIKDENGACPTTVVKATRSNDDEEDSDEASEDSDDQEDGEAEKEKEHEHKDKCQKGCTRELDPLCGSDGKTYNNHCLFEIAHCRNSSLAVKSSNGPCAEK